MSENIKKNAKKNETKRRNRIFRKPKKRLSQTKNKNLPMDQVLHLQRTIGNRAVARLIKSGAIQAKLKIDRVSRLTLSQPNDIYEKEADNVADRVMSMKDGALVQKESAEEEKEGIQTKPLAEQITPLIQRQANEEEEVQSKLQRQAEEEEEKEPIQTKLIQRQGAEEEEEVQTKLQRQPEEEEEKQAQPKAAPGGTPKVAPNIESNINSMKGGGQPLSESARSFFEPRFGADFSQVRVHTDEKASKIAGSINAKAFTTGKDIAFNSGQYSPGTSSGKRLLAHELTHTLQQSKAEGSSTGRTINRKTQGEKTREKAKNWLDVDSKLKIEVDVLKAAIREVKREKSVSYNKKAGLKRLDNAAGILNIKGDDLTKLKNTWIWLVDNRKKKAQKTYKANQTKFFNKLKSPLAKIKKKYPRSQTHYWLKNTPAQVFDIIHKVGDKAIPPVELWVYASKEGLIDYIRDQIGLSQKAHPTETQLKQVSVTKKVSGFVYLGLDDFFTELKTRRQPLKALLPSGFDLSKVKKDARINEEGRTVQSGIFPNLLTAIQALSAMMKRRRNIFQEDRKSLGYPSPNRDELVYWTYVYYNAGINGGKRALKKYKDKKNLSYLINKKNFPNAIKLLQSFKMVKEMKLF
jgi:hypothetical protein